MQQYCFIKIPGGYERIHPDDIIYIESDKNYLKIVMQHKKLLVIGAIDSFLKGLPAIKFCRVHKSYAVSLERIQFFGKNQIKLDGAGREKIPVIPIGRLYRKSFMEKIKVIKTM